MRRGDLCWRISATPDGALLADGLVPPLIQWDSPVHPAGQLPAVGCELLELRGWHPEPEPVRRMLETLGLAAEISISLSSASQAGLTARILAPSGEVTLGTHPSD